MGKGKKTGKFVFSIAAAAFGYLNPVMFGADVTAWAGALYGASLASTLWSVTQKPDSFGNLNSDYSQDDYNRFNSVTNDINQNAVIPVIYGTRKYGGLQVWSNPYNGSRNLEKDVVVCESGVDSIYNVMANEDLIKDDTNISIYNIEHTNATVKRTGNTLVLFAGDKTQEYKLGNIDNYDAQTSLLNTVIENIRADAGNGWQIDGAVDDRTSKGISADTMQFNQSSPVSCYVPLTDPEQKNKVVLDNRGYTIGTYEVFQDTAPDNYMDVGGYPSLAWIRSKLTASNRIGGGNPTINATIRGMQVDVYKNGEWVHEYSENPAWIIRDLLLSKRYGTGLWITEDMIDNESFIEVANYCDEMVEYVDFYGVVQREPRYRLNIILDSEKTPLDHLSSMLAVFGGFITFGKQISLKVEKAETPVYHFDDDIIVKDSMTISQTALEDTPNRYKIGYFDPAQNWTEIKVVVEDLELQHEMNDKIVEKTVTLAGCTSQSQALRIGRLYRDLNKVCSLTITFSVATQGMMLECGDVINVSYGGIFSQMPFRITQIDETSDGIYQLTCRQYNASIYNDELGAQITNPNYGQDNPYTDKIPAITGLVVTENTFTTPEGQLQIGIKCNWNDIYYKYFNHYEVSLSVDGKNYQVYSNTYTNEAIILGLNKGKYWVAVQVVSNDGIKGSPAITTINITGTDAPPPDVKFLDTDILNDETRRFWWTYEYPSTNDIAGFKLKYTQGNNPDWDNAYDLHTGLITQQPFETKALRQGVHTVMIKAVDNAGTESTNAAFAVLNLGDLLEDNVLWSKDLSEDNWKYVNHNGEVVNGTLYNKDGNNLELTAQFQPLAYGQFWIEYEINCSATVEYFVGSNAYAWHTPTTNAWKSPDTPAWLVEGIYKPYTGKVMLNSTDSVYLKIIAKPNQGQQVIINKLKVYVDVPDRVENFENLTIPEEGLTLPIKTPYYHTIAVKVNAIQTDNPNPIEMEYINKTPCRIRFNQINNDAGFTKTPVEVVADLTWQGFRKEVII